MMRTAVAVSIGLAALAGGSGEAKAQNAPWCAIVEIGVGMAENCGFQSYEHCIATVRGQGGYCERNSRYQPPVQERSDGQQRRRER